LIQNEFSCVYSSEVANPAGVGKWFAQPVRIISSMAQSGGASIFLWKCGFVRDFPLALGLHGNQVTGWSRRTA
jgi:hypothetical protein